MITYLKTENFKSLHEIEICFSEFTVLVGNNAAGKSSVLQAIDFYTRSCQEDFSNLLEERGMDVSDIFSKLSDSKDKNIRFVSEWRVPFNNSVLPLFWDLKIEIHKNNLLYLAYEKIVDMRTNTVLLSYNEKKDHCLTIFDKNENRIYPKLRLEASALKVAVDVDEEQGLSELVEFKKYLLNSCSYDLLSPNEMRQSSRGRVTSIGGSGRDLPAFIKSMSDSEKQNLLNKLHQLLGSGPVVDIKAKSAGRPGWTRIEATEHYGDHTIAISSKNMSDGMLRLIAFLAISESTSSPSIIMMDEIENGININYAEELINILREACERKHLQMIVTTHSTVFLDYVNPDDIVFLYRDSQTGLTKSENMNSVPGIKEKLKYMYPGELLLNMSNEEILGMLLSGEGRVDRDRSFINR